MDKWRGWWIPVWEARPRLLSMEYDHDVDGPPEQRPRTTSWDVVTEARCKVNPDHTPPVPECVCGCWGMGLLDTLYSWQMRAWERRYVEKQRAAGVAGLMPDSQPNTHIYVIGRVTLYDVIRDDIEPHPGLTLPHWRGKSARIREFWVPTNDTQTAKAATQMAAKLEAQFAGVPVHIGAPGYGPDDWDERTPFAGTGPNGVELPDFPDVGLHPPGDSAALTYPVAMARRQDRAATVSQLLEQRTAEVMVRREDLARAVAAQRAERRR